MTNYFSPYIPAFKALSDETRLKIIQMLTCEEMHANSILECFHLTQPSLSYHMKILTASGLVRARRRGGFTLYSVDGDKLETTIALLREFMNGPEVRPALREERE